MLDRLLAIGSLPVLVLALLAGGLGLPLPEDPVILAAGVVAHRSDVPWWLVLLCVYCAAIGADCLLFLWARRFGEGLLHRGPLGRLVTPARRQRGAELFARHGPRAVFIGRHIIGLRTIIFVIAGIEGMSLGSFVRWDALAGLITLPVLFALGYMFSDHVDAVAAGIAGAKHWIAAVLGAALLVAWFVWALRER